MELPQALICDLDSTLANNDHRAHHADNKDWQTFHDLSGEDKPHDWCVQILESMHIAHPEMFFFFITGRPNRVREGSEKWLNDVLSPTLMNNSTLYMKPAGWKLGTPELKKTIYKDKIEGKFDILFVMEDERKVVDMWRSLGLVCLQPEDNNYE